MINGKKKKGQEYQFLLKKNTLKKDTKYFLQNCYSEVGKTIFRQIIGIPMGSDPAPSFANLFQHVLKQMDSSIEEIEHRKC